MTSQLSVGTESKPQKSVPLAAIKLITAERSGGAAEGQRLLAG
jgi:hypothetical protein